MPEIRVQFPVGPLNNTVLWPSGEGSSLTRRRIGVRVHPGLLQRRDAQIRQSAERLGLNPECLQVRVLLWVLTKQRLGRQLADHLGLEPGMLWVRLPPEPLANNYVLVEQRSARLPVTQEIVGSNPIGDARQHGTVRKPVKRRSSNLRDRLWVRLPPVLLEQHASAGHWRAQLAVNQPPPGCAGSTPARRTDNTWPVRLTAGCETLKLATRVRFPYGSLTQPSGGTGIRATLRTSCPLGHASSTLALATDIAGAAGAQLAFIRPVCPVRYRDLQLDAGGPVLIRAS